MSGHSKWHSIRHKKGAADAKRGKIFSKLAKLISVAAKEGGGDLDMNFSLRMLVDKAKAANMPKDNIERAIARGTGEGAEGMQMTEAVYEAIGPGGSSLVIETLTDNTNRTLGSIKTICNKRGANFPASVLWQFAKKGVVHIEDASSVEDKDSFELELIESGAVDIDRSGVRMSIVSEMQDLQAIVEAVKTAGLETESAGLEYVANDSLLLSADDEVKLGALIEALEDDDDVNAVYTNAA